MKTLLMAFLVLFSTPLLAQTTDHDGNWYLTLDTFERTNYLVGFADGAAMLGKHASYSMCLPATSPNSIRDSKV